MLILIWHISRDKHACSPRVNTNLVIFFFAEADTLALTYRANMTLEGSGVVFRKEATICGLGTTNKLCPARKGGKNENKRLESLSTIVQVCHCNMLLYVMYMLLYMYGVDVGTCNMLVYGIYMVVYMRVHVICWYMELALLINMGNNTQHVRT